MRVGRVGNTAPRYLYRCILLTTALVSVLILSGCKKEEPDTLSLNLQTWVGHGPIYLAIEKGFFEDEGLLVDLIPDEIAENRNFAFKQDILDAEGSSIDLLIHKRNEEIPVVAIMAFDKSIGADGIIAKDTIQTVHDLKGKTIALERKNVGEAFLSYVLTKNDISLDEVTLVPVGGSDEAAQAYLDGKADAAVTWEPWLSLVKEEKDSHVLITTKEEPGVIVDILVAREAYINENKEALQKFVRGWFRAIDYIKQYPDESISIMSAVYDMEPADYTEALEGLEWPLYEENLAYFDPEQGQVYDVYDKLSSVFLNTGAIHIQEAPQQAITHEILSTLYAEG